MTDVDAAVVHDEAPRNAIFAAPADDPRTRRPADVVALVGSLIFVYLLGSWYRSRTDIDQRVLEFFDDGVPGWISGIATIIFFLSGVYVVVLGVGIIVYGEGRRAIARDMLVAAGLAFGGVVLASYAAAQEFPHVAPEFRSLTGYPAFPVVRLAATLAAVRVAGPFLSVPMRKIGRRLVAATAIAAVVLSYGTVTAMLGGIFIGIAAAAAVHLVFGSGLGIPSAARITAALGEAGLDVVDIEYLEQQSAGAILVRAQQADGTSILVKVYGRDASDAARAARAWRAIWYVGESKSVTVSRLQLAEHEALVLLALERAGVPAVRLVSGTRSSTGDVVLATEWEDGPRLSDLVEEIGDDADADHPDDADDAGAADDDDGAVVDDGRLSEMWSMLEQLHERGISHNGLTLESFVISDRGPLFVDVGSAEFALDDERAAGDRAQLLVATAVLVGPDRAIDEAVRRLDHDDCVAMLPLLQPAALPRTLQHEVGEHDLSVDDLRDALADRIEVEAPELVKLRRVSWGSVVMVALTVFAASSLIGALTEIGFDTIANEFANAQWGWVLVAFVTANLTNFGEYITMGAVVGKPVPFGPTMMLRYAISFISLAVPSDAGAIAMNVRYQQKLGVKTAAAIAQGPLLTIFSKGFDIILLLITVQFVGRTVDFDELDLGPAIRLIVIVCVLAVLAIVLVFVIPSVRERVMPHIKEGFGAVRGSLTDPSRLGRLTAGTLLQKILFALTLSASVAAYGGDLAFASAIFVNSAVSLFLGFVPVPGGIGVGESALAAGMIAVGVPSEIALAAAITHRMMTSYIPPVFGWWSSRWLARNGYL